MKFQPGLNFSSSTCSGPLRGCQNHPCLRWNVSYCLHVFAEMKLHPGMKKRKKKKTCKHFIRGWNFKMSIFFKLFDVCIQICLPKLTYLNISPSIKSEAQKQKGWGQQVKYKSFKNIFIISIIFFVKFRKDRNFHLL